MTEPAAAPATAPPLRRTHEQHPDVVPAPGNALVRPLRGVRALVLAGVVGALAACGGGGASADDLAASRDEVREVARADVPAVVDALGGRVEEAWGEFEFGGDGVRDRRRYAVTAVVEGTTADRAAIVAAFEDAGYEITQDLDRGVVGVRDDVRISTAVPHGSTLSLGVTGAWLELAGDPPRDSGRQDVDLG